MIEYCSVMYRIINVVYVNINVKININLKLIIIVLRNLRNFTKSSFQQVISW